MNSYTRRPSQPTGRGRFWLALSLSTVTAASVAVPLALKAVNADRVPGGPAAPTQEQRPEETPTIDTSVTFYLPDIGVDEQRSGRGNIVPDTGDGDNAPNPASSSTATTTTTTVPADPGSLEPTTTSSTEPPASTDPEVTTTEDPGTATSEQTTSTTTDPTSSSVAEEPPAPPEEPTVD